MPIPRFRMRCSMKGCPAVPSARAVGSRKNESMSAPPNQLIADPMWTIRTVISHQSMLVPPVGTRLGWPHVAERWQLPSSIHCSRRTQEPTADGGNPNERGQEQADGQWWVGGRQGANEIERAGDESDHDQPARRAITPSDGQRDSDHHQPEADLTLDQRGELQGLHAHDRVGVEDVARGT